NAGMPAVRSASASPAASGASGPMMTTSAVCWRAAATTSATAVAEISRLVPSWAVPGLPGAANRVVAGGKSRVSAQASAWWRPARLLVILGLDQEAVEIHLLHVPAARELEVHAERSGRVLRREEPGAVRGHFALAIPLEQGQLDGEQRDAGEEGKGGEAGVEQQPQDGAVQGVAAHHVPQLVSQ